MKLQLLSFLFEKVDATIICLFRIVFGAFMVYEMIYYFQLDFTFQLMAGPEVLFTFPYLEFIKPLPLFFLKGIHLGLFIAAVCISVGIFYRIAIVYFFIGYTYFFLVDTTLYNNHIYLIILIAFVLIFMDADKRLSLKNYWVNRNNTSIQSVAAQVPIWNIRILQFLFFIVYFYGGIAKINADWLSGDIIRVLLRSTLGEAPNWAVYFLTYGGMIFDLLIGFFLLIPKTRWYAIIIAITFHLTNGLYLFSDIGLFPYLMIACTIIFLDPAHVSHFFKRLFIKKVKVKDKQKKGRRAKKESPGIKKSYSKKQSQSFSTDNMDTKKKSFGYGHHIFSSIPTSLSLQTFSFTRKPRMDRLGNSLCLADENANQICRKL